MQVKPSTVAKVAAGLAVAGAVAAIVTGQMRDEKLEETPAGDRTTIHWRDDGTDTPPEGAEVKCTEQHGFGVNAQLDGLKLKRRGDGGTHRGRYGWSRTCGVVVDAGISIVPELPGFAVNESTQVEVPYDGGPMAIFVVEGPELGGCACSTKVDSGCEWRRHYEQAWEAAPKAALLLAGQWRGACVAMPCEGLSGFDDPMPEGCR